MAIADAPPRLGRSALLVAVGGAVGNGMQYVLAAGLSRAFRPEQFGALAALLGLALVCAIPGTALQLVIGRQSAQRTRSRTDVTFGTAGVVGCGLAVVVALTAPLTAQWLHLDGLWPVMWLSVTLVPSTVSAGLNGCLLGRERFGRFAGAQVLTSACRLLVLPLVLTTGWGVTGTMAALCVATVVSCGLVAVLVGPDPAWARPHRGSAGALAQAAAGVSGFVLLTNLDLLLARHVLSPRASGLYALASLFTKAGLWGTQFIAIVVYPRLARSMDRRLLLGAAAATAAVGLAGAAVAVAVAPTLVERLSGADYAPVGDFAPLFVVLGTALALVHLALVASIAVGRRAFTHLLWTACAVEVLVVLLLSQPTPVRIATLALVVAVAVAAVGLSRSHAPRPEQRAVSVS